MRKNHHFATGALLLTALSTSSFANAASVWSNQYYDTSGVSNIEWLVHIISDADTAEEVVAGSNVAIYLDYNWDGTVTGVAVNPEDLLICYPECDPINLDGDPYGDKTDYDAYSVVGFQGISGAPSDTPYGSYIDLDTFGFGAYLLYQDDPDYGSRLFDIFGYNSTIEISGDGLADGEGNVIYSLTAYSNTFDRSAVSAVPIPAAAWLFGSGLLGLIGVARHKKTA